MKAGIHFFLLLVGFFVYGSLNAQSAAPNIIFILADDMGYGDVSALNKNSKINTPALDELIKQGMNFTDAHSASSVCTPSRYAVLTGRYAWRSPLKQGVLQPYDPPLIENNRLTVAAMLQQKGYATACIGKWHLGWNWPLVTGATFADSLQQGNNNAKRRGAIESYINYTAPVKDGPLTKGFSYYFGVDVPNFPPYIFIENDRIQGTPSVKKPDSMFGIAGNMQPGWSLENILPTLAQKSSAYIKQQAQNKQPFFLYVPLISPHSPIAPNAQFKGSSHAGGYGDYVQETDWVVSEILKAVDEAGIGSNTMVVFTSDNGSPETDGENYYGKLLSVNKYDHDPSNGYRGIKADIWEGGHHVPLIVRWPGKVKPGTQSSATVCLSDFMATCADLFQIKLNSNEAEDSYSLLPLFKQHTKSYKRAYTVHHSIKGYFAIRKGDWKLVMCAGSGGWTAPQTAKPGDGLAPVQLYNIKTDPFETNNVEAAHPHIVRKLKKQLSECIVNGRSTKGAPQTNEGVFIPETVTWLR